MGDRLQFRRYIAEMRKTNYEFSSTQANLPKQLADRIIKWGKSNIPNKDIFRDPADPSFGRETEMHVTILYGLHDSHPDEIEEFIEFQEPFEVELGVVSLFTSHDKFDVVKLEASGSGLFKLNKLLRNNFNYTNKFPEYKPHVTIAYIKKDLGNELVKDDTFKGQSFLVDKVKFSSKNGSSRMMPLKGKKPA